MYRLLIVDDEPVIVNGLVLLFQDNSELELEVCKAYSAKEALEMAQKMKLDILVSDIRMPQISGLQLVDEITYYWPHCRSIFLTGYSEFEYVHEALRKNVDNYILKTEGIELIFEAVKQAIAKLDEENQRRILDERARRHFEIAAPLLKTELLRRMTDGEDLSHLLLQPRYEEVCLQISLEQSAFFMIGRMTLNEADRGHELRQAVQRTFLNYLPSSIKCECSVINDDTLLWLLQPEVELLGRFQANASTELHWNGITQYMKGILELVQNEGEELLGVHVSFGISANLQGSWDRAGQQYEQLQNMLKARAALGQTMIIADLEKADPDEEKLYEHGRMEQDEARIFVIDQIQRYVIENLSGDVSLTAIAEEVHFNPSYLSRYYKQATGHNLLEYIQTKRLEGAIHLMQDTNLKLNEIAARVGFDSHSYFTTFFKKKMGVTPQEYRNSLAESS
ncbi:response regulator [Paenibacillus aceti]|uniref:DNA-binding response regulator n=1 Tax=Paenibacillus aceti TaxID=1820010 RepID=A0ABQ1VXV1_9BACL|nr:response regulator [Paenibacillus aceti]GGG03418.1 hypothetical protein GCM10010913_26560 [Paenibacillus aceti]